MDVEPLNSWGDSFWKRHFKCFWWLKYIIFYSFDLIEDKFKIPELSIILGATYILDVNTQILGLYSFGDYCYSYSDNVDSTIPAAFNANSSFSIFSHYFYFLLFVGNIKSCPRSLSIICALYNIYDAIVKVMDASTCPVTGTDGINYVFSIIPAYSRAILSAWSLFLWIVLLTFPKKYHKKAQFYEIIGNIVKYIVLKILCCKKRRKTKRILEKKFKYPLRIIIAAWLSYAVAIATILQVISIKVLIYSYQLIYLIEYLKSDDSGFYFQKSDHVILAFGNHNLQSSSDDENAETKDKIILFLQFLYPSIVISFFIGHAFVIYSILLMLYKYKQFMLIIIEDNDRSFLRQIWKFSSHSAMFFIRNYKSAQFVVNTLFLQFVYSFFVFFIFFIIVLFAILVDLRGYLASQTAWFWLGFIPLILGIFYFPRLVEKNNKVKNKLYLCFWDGWNFFIGFVGAFVKGLTRYILGSLFAFFVGFKAHRSVMPYPFDSYDALYVSFYGCIVLHCVSLGILPDEEELHGIDESQDNSRPFFNR